MDFQVKCSLHWDKKDEGEEEGGGVYEQYIRLGKMWQYATMTTNHLPSRRECQVPH